MSNPQVINYANPFDFSDPTVQRIITRIAAIKRKLTPADVDGNTTCRVIAEWYATQYTGTFPFMVSMHNNLQRAGTLTAGQVSGTLNCLFNDYQYQIKRQAEIDTLLAKSHNAPQPLTDQEINELATTKPMPQADLPNTLAIIGTRRDHQTCIWCGITDTTCVKTSEGWVCVDRQPCRDRQRATKETDVTSKRCVLDGTFTIVLNEAGTYRTLRIASIDEEWLGDKPVGTQVASYLSGADNETQYTAFAYIFGDRVAIFKKHKGNTELAKALDVLMKSDREAQIDLGATYAMESNNCWRCGRKLTVPASINRGLGPICAEKI